MNAITSASGKSFKRLSGRRMRGVESLERRMLYSAAPTPVADVRSGLSSASDLGSFRLSSQKLVRGSVGLSRSDQVYKVTVSSAIDLRVALTGLLQTDHVDLLFPDGTAIGSGWSSSGRGALSVSQRLDPGTYYIDVSHGLIAPTAATGLVGATAAAHVHIYHFRRTDGFTMTVRGVRADHTTPPQAPTHPTGFAAAFSRSNASSLEPSISSDLASQSGFAQFQSFSADPLWGPSGPSPDDVLQTGLGDCYFLSVLSGIARADPGLIEQSIVPQSNGNFLVKFTYNGQEFDQQVDASLPVDSSGNLVFARLAGDNAIWPALMEKAFCYYPGLQSPGSYDAAQGFGQGGLPSLSLGAMGSTDAGETSVASFRTSAQFLSTVSSELAAGDIVDLDTTSQSGTGNSQLPSGLFSSHAYSVVAADPGSNTIEVRNPWGTNTEGNLDDGTGGYITISGDAALQSIAAISQGTVPQAAPNPTVPPPPPPPGPTPNPTNEQDLQGELGPNSFQFSDGSNVDVFTFTANAAGQVDVVAESTGFTPQVLVAEVGSDGQLILIGTARATGGSTFADVTFTADPQAQYEIGVWSAGGANTGSYTLAVVGNVGTAQQLTPFASSASLSGVVYEDLNGDGVQQNNEPGLQGWTVYVDLADQGTYVSGDPVTTTDQNGAYTFTGLDAGTYVVRIIPQSGWNQSAPQGNGAGWQLSAAAGQDNTVNAFGEVPQATGTLFGTVYYDQNADGTQESNEPGLSGWVVYLDLTNQGSYVSGDPYAITDSSGNYTFSGLPAGTYIVRLIHVNGWTTTQGANDWHTTLAVGETHWGGSFGEV